MAMNFESEIALLEMRKQRGTDTVDDRVTSSAIAESLGEKMNCFIKAQTKLHSHDVMARLALMMLTTYVSTTF